jgi:hypothetical protein
MTQPRKPKIKCWTHKKDQTCNCCPLSLLPRWTFRTHHLGTPSNVNCAGPFLLVQHCFRRQSRQPAKGECMCIIVECGHYSSLFIYRWGNVCVFRRLVLLTSCVYICIFWRKGLFVVTGYAAWGILQNLMTIRWGHSMIKNDGATILFRPLARRCHQTMFLY